MMVGALGGPISFRMQCLYHVIALPSPVGSKPDAVRGDGVKVVEDPSGAGHLIWEVNSASFQDL